MSLAREYLLTSGPMSMKSISPLASASICASGSIARKTMRVELRRLAPPFLVAHQRDGLRGLVDAVELERTGRRERTVLPASLKICGDLLVEAG